VTKADGTVVENIYDVDGVLVRTAVNGVATDYLVDTSGGLSHVVAEVDGSGTVAVLYVRAGDLLLEEVRGGVAKMYEADGLGSVRGLLDVSGAKTDTYAYEAFGSTISSTGSDANPYRFAGERLVDSVGFYQNRARWLDTRTGLFVSVDPMCGEGSCSQPINLHPYLYGRASPVSYNDPAGMMPDVAMVTILMNVELIGSAMPSFGSTMRQLVPGPTGEELKERFRPVLRDAFIATGATSKPATERRETGGYFWIVDYVKYIADGRDIKDVIRIPEERLETPGEKRLGNAKGYEIALGCPGTPPGPRSVIVGNYHAHPVNWDDIALGRYPEGPSSRNSRNPNKWGDQQWQNAMGVPGIVVDGNGYWVYGPAQRRKLTDGPYYQQNRTYCDR
jgi:RHS repeat-associated protein